MSDNLPILLIEGVLVLGGALLFGWWQLRDVKRAQRDSAQRRADAARAEPAGAAKDATPQ